MITVDFTADRGTIRRLNGVNLAPRLSGSANHDMNTPFKALSVPIARFHDAPLDNPGTRLVDPHLIFANGHAATSDPRNYYFRQTDDYLSNCPALGTDLHYRLGPSIEHSIRKYFICPPENMETWLDVCTHIVRHYNEGWNDGFEWDIRYWTVWEEPENPRLFDGEPMAFFRLFDRTVKHLKARFPRLKLGTVIGCHLPPQWTADFLEYCQREKVPMDFFGWSLYKGDLDEVIGYPRRIREMIDGYGYTDTELHIAEWNYTAPGLGFSGREANESPEGCYGYDGAAFAAAVLIGWQDTPLTMANYYTASVVMGLFDRYVVPKKNYYGLLAFGELTKHSRRVAAHPDAHDVKVLAGVNDAGAGAILVSAFKSDRTRLELSIQGVEASAIEVLCVDPGRNLEPVAFEMDSGCLILEKQSGSAVFLMKGFQQEGFRSERRKE